MPSVSADQSSTAMKIWVWATSECIRVGKVLLAASDL